MSSVSYPLGYYARSVARRDRIPFADAVRILARDAGASDADSASVDDLSSRMMIQHDDGSLEFIGGRWVD